MFVRILRCKQDIFICPCFVAFLILLNISLVAASAKLGMVSVGSAKLAKSGIDDLLSSIDGGKHDYDW